MMSETSTAYALVIMCGDKIYAVRDPFGNRPLCIGKLLSATCLGSKEIQFQLFCTVLTIR